MRRKRSGFALALLASVALAPAAGAQPAGRSQAETRIEDLIGMIHAAGDANARTTAAAQLAEYVAAQGSDAARLHADVIDDLTALLSDGDDWVRFYGAAALGFVGLPARRAIPALERAFEQARAPMTLDAGQPEVFSALNSAGAICTAFTRIDLSRMPAGCENYH